MTDKAFWDFVATLNWSDQDPNDVSTHIDTYKIKAKILWNHSPREVQEIENTFDEKRGDLYYAVSDHIAATDSPYISNDALSDTLCQIVGEGEEAYDIAMNRPELVVERLQDSDYIESFAYVIPNVDAYQMISTSRYRRLFYKYENALESVYSDIAEKHQDDAYYLLKALSKITYEHDQSKLNDLVEISEQLTESSAVYQNAVGYGVQNTIRDYIAYVLPFR